MLVIYGNDGENTEVICRELSDLEDYYQPYSPGIVFIGFNMFTMARLNHLHLVKDFGLITAKQDLMTFMGNMQKKKKQRTQTYSISVKKSLKNVRGLPFIFFIIKLDCIFIDFLN